MPGVLSFIFDPGSEDAGCTQENVVTADSGVDLAVGVDVGLDLGVTYQDADGGTHSWQTENDIGVDAGVGAALGTILTSDEAVTSAGG